MSRTLDNATDQKTLEDLIQHHRAGSEWQLPNLKVEPSKLDQLWERFWRWIGSFFPTIEVGNSGIGSYIALLMTLLKYLLIIALVAGAIWIIYQLARWAFRKAPPEKMVTPRETKRREELETLLAAAEAAGDWALAARILWKMFLRNIEEKGSVTPFEYHRRFPQAIPDVKLPYQLMFAPDGNSQSHLSSFRQMLDAWVTQREKRGEP